MSSSARYKAIKITDQGTLTYNNGDAVMCPVRSDKCTVKCAWYSHDGAIARCQNTIIGVTSRQKTIRSFRLSN